MFYRLKEQFSLRGWEKLPYALVRNRKPLFITQKEMEALKLCNGKIDLALPLIDPEIREMIPVLEKNGIIEPCKNGETILPEQEYRYYPNRYIRSAHWSVTGRCNFRCRHCYMSAPDAKYGELSHDDVMKIVDELAACGVMSISLTGGECLVRDDFLEIVDALLANDIYIHTIYTNGALVNEKLLTALDQRGIQPEFNMSFDGVGWHDWLRGIKGAEDMVNRAFRLCQQYHFPTGAEMCVHRRNKDTIRESILHLQDVGCRSLKIVPVSDVGEWQNNGLGSQSLPMEELLQIYLDYIPRFYEDGMPLSLQLGGFFSASPSRPDEYDIPAYKYPEDPAKCCVCGHSRMVMYISPEGRTLPCMSLSGMEIQEKFPLITETGLAKCLTDSFYMDFIDTRADIILNHNPECRECPFGRWCHGGCRAAGLEFSEQKDLYAKDEMTCSLFKDGWALKIIRKMKEINPQSVSPASLDKELIQLLEDQSSAA